MRWNKIKISGTAELRAGKAVDDPSAADVGRQRWPLLIDRWKKRSSPAKRVHNSKNFTLTNYRFGNSTRKPNTECLYTSCAIFFFFFNYFGHCDGNAHLRSSSIDPKTVQKARMDTPHNWFWVENVRVSSTILIQCSSNNL